MISKLIKNVGMVLSASLVSMAVHAVPVSYVEGTHYFPTANKLPTEDPNVVEVVELFSYTCPHCFNLEGSVHEWAKDLPENVKFVQMPAIFRDSWLLLAKVFYAAEARGELEQLHSKLFNAIHVEKKRLTTEENILDFIEEQGIDRDAFAKTMNSFSVNTKVKKALMFSQASGITGVPSIIVNGQYRSDAPAAGSMKELLDVVDFLIEQNQQ